jgi:hypothetical protein
VRHSRALFLSFRTLVVASTCSALFGAACGGGNGGGNGNGRSNPPAPTPSQTQPNPCSTVTLDADAEAGSESTAALRARKLRGLHGDAGRYAVLDQLWKSRAETRRRGLAPPPSAATVNDVGEIAVVQDQGDILLRPNPFDLGGKGLRFSPDGAGYDIVTTDAGFRQTLGEPLVLEDDATSAAAVGFGFTLYGRPATRAFINSDGNITFGEGDAASTERDVSRLLTGPPRVSPFLADLDPTSGGRVFLRSSATEFTVTWCGVRGFDSPDRATVQVTLLPGGVIDMKYDDEGTTLGDAVVGLSPGNTGDFNPVDLSTPPADGGNGAVGERFSSDLELDFVALSRAFYGTHGDLYDQLVVWSDVKVTRGSTFAFEFTVSNQIRGLGLDTFDTSGDFGSAGRLESIVMMDTLSKYPDNPQQKVIGESSTVALLGHETGHRWLAFLEFRDHEGETSDRLLGRDLSHWSFFFDSDASVMEGNDIEELGGGRFRTVAAGQRYSRLDQYAMGLSRESEVPPFFYVDSPVNVQPSNEADSDPQVGVTFSGTKRTVLLADVIAAMGRRQPAAGSGPRVHRQAFLFVVGSGRSATSAQIAKLDRIRREWVGFFSDATDERSRVETRLEPPS